MNPDILKYIRDNFEKFYWGDSQPDSATMGSIMGSYLTFLHEPKQNQMWFYKTVLHNTNQFKSSIPFNSIVEGYQIIEEIIALAKDKNSEDDYDTEKIAYTEKYINENFAN